MTLRPTPPGRWPIGPGTAFPTTLALDHGGRQMEVFDCSPLTLAEVFHGCDRYAQRIAIEFRDESWTYAEMGRVVTALAQELRSAFGVEHGTRIAVAARNYPEWVFAFWAAQVLGAILVPVNAWMTADSMRAVLKRVRPRVLFLDTERLSLLGPSIIELDCHVVSIRSPRSENGAVDFNNLVDRDGGEFVPERISPHDVSTLLFTSGTTGTPKGVPATHRNHVTNLLLSAMRTSSPGLEMGSAEDFRLLVYPFFHIAGISQLYQNAYLGRSTCLMYKWDVDEALRVIRARNVRAYAGPALTVRELVDALKVQPETTLRSLGGGGGLVPASQVSEISRLYGATVQPNVGYGLTETTGAVTSLAGSDYVEHPTSVGRPLPLIEVRIVDEALRDVGDGESGELIVRGPTVVNGYLDQSDLTAQSFVEGWFRTGDLARRDQDGYLYLVGRLKDVIIRGGENISAGEVESAMGAHPDVAEVAAVGVPDPKWGELVAVVLRLRSGAQATEVELRAFVESRLPVPKVPAYIVLSEEALPRNATGKIDKEALRQACIEALVPGPT